MKYLKKIAVIVLIVLTVLFLLLFAGCNNQTLAEIGDGDINKNADSITQQAADSESETAPESGKLLYEDGFVFMYNGTAVYMGDYIENFLAETGLPSDYIESESCTSAGLMRTYAYGGLEIYTYAKSESEEYRIFSVALFDDSSPTAEGIYIGQTVDDMIKLYGADCESLPGFFYTYEKNGTSLSFNIDGDIITAITYKLLNV